MRNRVRNLQPQAIQRARALRKNMSESERQLWRLLRHKQLGGKFRRQYPAGPYVLDFYCPQTKLCVELDGDTHAGRLAQDTNRDAWLASHGIHTIRVTTAQLYEHPGSVVECIHLTCMQRSGQRKEPPP